MIPWSMDYTYILVIIGAAISALASAYVNITFQKYSKYSNSRGLRAEDAAGLILRNADTDEVRIERISGSLTDHYSPSEKVLRLSDTVYHSTSVAAIGVAAHECGHAIQHKVGYFPIKLRSIAVPVANIGSKLSWPVILIGLIFGLQFLVDIGIFLFLFVLAFQLITLPVEFNASRRAIKILDENDYLSDEELKGAKKTLKAAALTYVASAFSTILQLFRLILIAGGRRRND